MADIERENALGVVDKRWNSLTSTTGGQTTPANLLTVSALRTRLAAINGSLYTAAKLNQMSKNDMVYAVRLADEAGGMA